MSESERNILVVSHAGRADVLAATEKVINKLHLAGARVVLCPQDRDQFVEKAPGIANLPIIRDDVAVADIEVAMVLGGDGTILRAAELVREGNVPILGVNLGHVGFLAESERDDLDDTVARVIAGDYRIEERLALDVRVKDNSGAVVYRTWALNDATVQKISSERMIEVALEVEQRPVSSFGCDGIVVSTPTGSTAYNFSAGGPIIWPGIKAIAVVPLSAHALFAKPLVVSSEHPVAIEVLGQERDTAILWGDGRRSYSLPPGARVVVRSSSRPVLLARVDPSPFTDRLVRKFHLPVSGWRGENTEASSA